MTSTPRRLLWPGIMTAAMLIVLLGLGTWQVKRLFWKLDILAQIDRAETSPPVALPASPSPFAKVFVTGSFLPNEAALYGADVRTLASGPAMGAQMIEPLREADGHIVLVDRGWIPLSRTVPIDQPEGPVTVTGYMRPGDTVHWFSAKDNLVERRFFTLDPKAIGDAIGQPDVRPFILVALAASAQSGEISDRWPDPARHLPRPPNNHLSYVITWYGLAVALLAIFVVWARRESRG